MCRLDREVDCRYGEAHVTRPGSSAPTAHLIDLVARFNLVSALAGMAALTIGGGIGIPLEWIEGSMFTSYFWPGMILGVVVGGLQLLALIAQYRGFRLAWGLHAAAGLVMMIWIFVEIAIMLAWSPLQGIYFSTGLIQTVLAVLGLGAWPSPFWRRTVKRSRPWAARCQL